METHLFYHFPAIGKPGRSCLPWWFHLRVHFRMTAIIWWVFEIFLFWKKGMVIRNVAQKMNINMYRLTFLIMFRWTGSPNRSLGHGGKIFFRSDLIQFQSFFSKKPFIFIQNKKFRNRFFNSVTFSIKIIIIRINIEKPDNFKSLLWQLLLFFQSNSVFFFLNENGSQFA